jgi:hypothetical protein
VSLVVLELLGPLVTGLEIRDSVLICELVNSVMDVLFNILYIYRQRSTDRRTYQYSVLSVPALHLEPEKRPEKRMKRQTFQ